MEGKGDYMFHIAIKNRQGSIVRELICSSVFVSELGSDFCRVTLFADGMTIDLYKVARVRDDLVASGAIDDKFVDAYGYSYQVTDASKSRSYDGLVILEESLLPSPDDLLAHWGEL